MLKQKKVLKQQAEEEEERKKILEEKGVPEEHFLRKQRLEQFQSMLSLFKQKQKERKLNIVEKLLREDKLNKQSQPGLHKGHTKTSGRRTKAKESSNPALLSSNKLASDGGSGDVELQGLQESSSSDSDTEKLTPDTPQGKHMSTLIEPEIRGLWEKSPKPTHLREFSKPSLTVTLSGGEGGSTEVGSIPAGERTQGPKKGPSKAEVMIMKKAMEKLKRSKVSKQIAAGREFKVFNIRLVFSTFR